MKATTASSILFLVFLAGVKAEGTGCPTDSSISQTCLDAVLPPWPICTHKTAAEWVVHAQVAAERCCGDDIGQCKCPVKNSQKFQDRIGGYCSAVQNDCNTQKQNEKVNNLRGRVEFDREEQIQRIEESTP